jgi:hypothetical protein
MNARQSGNITVGNGVIKCTGCAGGMSCIVEECPSLWIVDQRRGESQVPRLVFEGKWTLNPNKLAVAARTAVDHRGAPQVRGLT